ncbi:MAG: T9SS type A sorting domain-containing protein, partial [Bacteroidetes bacterium]|nr:T9SS type A sorting domain-containing protein [Bacteroidota bacterium]
DRCEGVPTPGAAYVFAFDGASWTEEAKLTAADGAQADFFGISVSLSGDRALIGAHQDDDAGDTSGSAYVFVFDGTSWTEEAKLTASDAAAEDHFGYSVSLLGNHALIGAYGKDGTNDDTGAAYIFAFDGASWTEEAKLIVSNAFEGYLVGFEVSLSDNRALVVAIGDGHDGLGSGSAYIFAFDGISWNEEAKLIASDASFVDHFGVGASLSGDRALVGAHQAGIGAHGSAYIFDLPASTELTVTCAPVSPPIVIPAGGGGFAYDVEITNNGASSETFDIWIDIVGPGVSRTLGPATRTLAAGAQRSHTPNQNVPGSVPTGAYTHTCNVGAFPVADASAGFDWEKSAAMAPGEPNVIDWTTEAEFVAALGAHTSPDGRRPTSFSLQPAYPNPFNPSTTIRFSLPERAYVELKVFDRLGREVARLVDGTIEAGRHEVLFNAPALPSGVYFARFSAGGFAQTQRLTLLK